MTLAFDITDGCGLVMKLIVNSCQRRALFAIHFHSKRHFTSCTLLTRWRATVLKVKVPSGREVFKGRLQLKMTLLVMKIGMCGLVILGF